MSKKEPKSEPQPEPIHTVLDLDAFAGQNITSFNEEQLATWDEAKRLAQFIDSSGEFQSAGIHTLPITGDFTTSGIFIPSWASGPGGFPEPSDLPNSNYFLHFRFSNRMEGMNVGLVRGAVNRYPNSPDYVLSELLREVQEGARTA